MFSGVIHTPVPRGGAPALPNLGSSPLLVHTQFDLERPGLTTPLRLHTCVARFVSDNRVSCLFELSAQEQDLQFVPFRAVFRAMSSTLYESIQLQHNLRPCFFLYSASKHFRQHRIIACAWHIDHSCVCVCVLENKYRPNKISSPAMHFTRHHTICIQQVY